MHRKGLNVKKKKKSFLLTKIPNAGKANRGINEVTYSGMHSVIQ